MKIKIPEPITITKRIYKQIMWKTPLGKAGIEQVVGRPPRFLHRLLKMLINRGPLCGIRGKLAAGTLRGAECPAKG